MPDPDPYDTPTAPLSIPPLRPSRPRLASELLVACLMTSVFVTVATIVTIDQTYVLPDVPNVSQWTPLDDLVSAVLFIPLGFLIYWLHPAGWLFWIGFATTLTTRSRIPFTASIAASAWFGYLWPARFQALMGV